MMIKVIHVRLAGELQAIYRINLFIYTSADKGSLFFHIDN